MLKKLASLLFEEEEEVIEEELDPKPIPKKVAKPLVKEKVRELEPSAIASMNPVKEEVKKEELPRFEEVLPDTKVEQLLQTKKPEFGIEASQPVRPVVEVKPKKVEKSIYEFRPVISPIFGVEESRRTPIQKPIVEVNKHVKRSRINTVISPIYGDLEKSKEEVKAKPKRFVPHDPIETMDLPKIKAENYSLDDLLHPIKAEEETLFVSEATTEIEEGLHQISLFDDVK
jgi:hypothetical protein